MAINLKKGNKEPLGTEGKFTVGLSWDLAAGKTYDLDVFALMLNDKVAKGGKVINDNYLVGYMSESNPNAANLVFIENGVKGFKDPEGAVKHMGDNRDGEGDGDDESIVMDLAKLNPAVKSIIIAVNIYSEQTPSGVNFGLVRNPQAKLYKNGSTSPELVYELDEDYSMFDCVEVCEIYLHNGEWKFNAIGDGVEGGIENLLTKFGLQVG